MLVGGFFFLQKEVLKVEEDNMLFYYFGEKNKSLSVVNRLNIMKNTFADIVAQRVKRVH